MDAPTYDKKEQKEVFGFQLMAMAQKQAGKIKGPGLIIHVLDNLGHIPYPFQASVSL